MRCWSNLPAARMALGNQSAVSEQVLVKVCRHGRDAEP